uniref:Zinc finger protein 845-like n=1 Tax=Saccoglossus kowalevskii TaxID=10224 RepID=A0ABM0M5U9_SACKO|nr:PREDICTED: zinc finger protein 845-like [Saccoglossus kowalevskii]
MECNLMSDVAVLLSEPDYAKHFLQRLNEQRKENVFTDITLCAGSEQYPCHQAVLASCSPVCAETFKSQPNIISLEIHDVDADMLKLFIDFTYCGELRMPIKDVKKLKNVADHFEVVSLGKSCEKIINEMQEKQDLQTSVHGPEELTWNNQVNVSDQNDYDHEDQNCKQMITDSKEDMNMVCERTSSQNTGESTLSFEGVDVRSNNEGLVNSETEGNVFMNTYNPHANGESSDEDGEVADGTASSGEYCESNITLIDTSQKDETQKTIKSIGLKAARRRKHRCSICFKFFNALSTLNVHVKNCHNDQSWKCNVCDTSFPRKAKLQHHKYRLHCKQKCQHCDKEFDSLKHLSTNKDAKGILLYECDGCNGYFEPQVTSPFNCKMCWKSFGYMAELKLHQITHSKRRQELDIDHSEGERELKSYQCQQCDIVFKNAKTLNGHVRNCHSNQTWKCNICDTSYPRKAKLQQHNYRHHCKQKCQHCDKQFDCLKRLTTQDDGTGKLQYQCDGCNEYFEPQETSPFNCQICWKSFTCKTELKIHINMHKSAGIENESHVNYESRNSEAQANQYKCITCDKGFQNTYALNGHIYNCHSDLTWKCSICDKRYPGKIKLQQHKYRQHCKQSCIHCDKKFDSLKTLSTHTDAMGKLQYQCDGCNGYFESQETSPFNCKFCWKSLGHSYDLRLHENTHTGLEPQPGSVKCEECGEIFATRILRNEHHINDHKTTKYRCELCGKEFSRRTCHIAHVKKHKYQKAYTCPVCNKVFLRKDTFQEHCLIHTKRKPVLCHVCGGFFKSEKTLKLHQRQHRDPTKVSKHQCSDCGKLLTTVGNLKKHQRSVHEKIKHLCHICGKAYTSKQMVQTHMRTMHTEPDARPYSCQICDKTFKTRAAMGVHVRIVHQQERNHHCPVCGKAFFTTNKVKRHLQMHK